MKPVIGITGSFLINNGGTFVGYKRSYLNDDYIKSVINSGGVPVILPFNENYEATVEMVKLVDGVIFSGGHDVDPIHYGEEPLQKLGITSPERDDFDMAIYKEAIRLKKPILGICRGFQIINVINGGTLYQDLSYADFVKINHDQRDIPDRLTHSIKVENDKFLKNVKDGKYRVNSFHHQILKEVAPGFEISATTEDGVVEGIQKITDDEFIVGFQWHPEMLSASDDNAKYIFDEFIKVVSSRK